VTLAASQSRASVGAAPDPAAIGPEHLDVLQDEQQSRSDERGHEQNDHGESHV
jgi:hypothetical protein